MMSYQPAWCLCYSWGYFKGKKKNSNNVVLEKEGKPGSLKTNLLKPNCIINNIIIRTYKEQPLLLLCKKLQ